MTETINGVPLELLKRAVQIPSKASVEENHAAIVDRGRAQAELRDMLNASPVSEAKAQGVYSTDPLACTGCASGCFRCLNAAPVQQVSVPVACSCGREYPANSYSAGFISGSGMCEECDAATALDEVARLNASPVQQVSVPDVLREAIKWADHLCFECGALVQTRAPSVHVYNKTFEAVQAAKAMLAAAPAAPAADAGYVFYGVDGNHP